jgi:hypothetical protein
MILFLLLILGAAVFVEAWAFMLTVGMAHLHILEAIQPISYGVSLQFVLVTIPFQLLAIALGALGDA